MQCVEVGWGCEQFCSIAKFESSPCYVFLARHMDDGLRGTASVTLKALIQNSCMVYTYRRNATRMEQPGTALKTSMIQTWLVINPIISCLVIHHDIITHEPIPVLLISHHFWVLNRSGASRGFGNFAGSSTLDVTRVLCKDALNRMSQDSSLKLI